MRDRPLGLSRFWRLMPAIALTTVVALLLAGVTIALFSERSYRAQKVNELSVQAQILGSTVTAALAFDDRRAAQEYVRALKANPEIRAAAVYDATGALFASYAQDGEPPLPATVEARGPYFEDAYLVVVAPVTQDEATLGTVYLRAVTEPVDRRLVRYGGLALLVTMASLVVAVLGTAHAALTKANLELEDRAAELAKANATLHAQIAEREKAEAALRQVQKMETIGQLTGGVAHDFNNLLTIIIGNLERLRRRLPDSGELAPLKRAADNAMHGAERAAALTRSLLAFSRRQPLNPKPVDVNRLVSTMSDLLRRTFSEAITIETVLAGERCHAHVDPNQLESAILNLAVNARDAMPGGGKLTIETAVARLDASDAAEAEVTPGDYVVVSVADTGTGMSQEVLEKAFEPFFTTKDVGQGTGLGLSQVYGFVKQSGGYVRIYSAPGRGTTVRIHLPRLLAGDEAAETRLQVAALSGDRPSETVLVVEDEGGVRAYSVEILTELGYRVLEAPNGPAALEALDKQPGVALLFTDVGLPGGMNGRQLADEARRRRPDLKVLFTTGYDRNAIVHDGRLDPGVHLILKPFTHAELAAAVRNVLDGGANRPRILVVADEAPDRTRAVAALEDLGFLVVEAGTAAEAMERVRSADGRIAGAFIDIGLPDRRSDSLAADLRALCGQLPVILAGGYAEEAARERFASDPLVSFLEKPYEAARLAAALHAVGLRAPGAGRT